MISRVSTAAQHAAAIAQILKNQAALSKTQVQLASGKRILSPADDPIAATRMLGMERGQAQLEQYGRNADMASHRLGFGEQAFTDLGTLLDRINVLVVQASNGSMDDASLAAIATEVESRAGELLQIANRKDSNGEYLYAGYASTTQPFAAGAGGVTYAGDQGVRQLQISANYKLADGFNGQRVFMDIPDGNGAFTVATGVHTGTGIIGVNQVSDFAAWNAAAAAAAAVPQPHTYTIRFTAPDTWEVLDAGGTQVSTGSYTEGAAISFNGVQVAISGAPAAGDTFTMAPAGTRSLFRTMDDLVGALKAGADTPESRARLASELNRALTQLGRASSHVIDLRSETGARLSALDAAEAQRDDVEAELTGALGELRDLDYAEAISRLNQQVAGLQAAQSAYTRLGQLSLFDYL
jgi:flagellar hook-associated protein 3 FlgL